MPSDVTKESLKRLDALAPEARVRVESALKEALEREVVAGGLTGGAAAANIFSRGWIFSRLTPTATDEFVRVLPEMSKMSEDEFAKFATRLSELKSKSTGPQR